MKEITFGKDQVIFREGDNAATMYDILSGKVGIYKNYGAKNEQQIIVMEAGQVFGEMGMIEYYPRSATAVALEDTVVEELGESELRDYFKNKPEKLLQLMKVLSQRVRETTQKYMCAVQSTIMRKRVWQRMQQRWRSSVWRWSNTPAYTATTG